MNKIEIYNLLEKAYGEFFLDSISTLKENEKEYLKSNFYKETKIPLLKLYENYFQYKKAEYGIVEQFNTCLEELDETIIENKIINIINSLKENPTIKEILQNFSVEELQKMEVELTQSFKEIKK